MSSPKTMIARACLTLAALLALTAGVGSAEARERIRIAVGRSEVVTSPDEVHTIAIAEPKIADAAVGSQRTIVVSGKVVGITTLVVYGEAGRYSVYDVDVYRPNSEKQIALHVKVAEITDNAKRQLGFDFAGNGVIDGVSLNGGIFTGKVTPIPVSPLPAGPSTDGRIGFTNKFGDLHLDAAWQALESNGDIRVLASPTLVAASGDSAYFLAGGEIPIPIASVSGTGGSTITIVWKDYGVRLGMRPTVLDDGSIDLNVNSEVSQLDFNNAIRLSDTIVPALLTRNAVTTIALKPGEHLVIGGLKQTDSTKYRKRVPILGSIPLLGFFFSAEATDKTNRELLVVVTPEFVEASAAMPTLPTDAPKK